MTARTNTALDVALDALDGLADMFGFNKTPISVVRQELDALLVQAERAEKYQLEAAKAERDQALKDAADYLRHLKAAEQRATDMEREATLMLAAVVMSAGGEVTVHPKSMREDHDLSREEGLDGRITFRAALSAREEAR